jgi:hypothetical protein
MTREYRMMLRIVRLQENDHVEYLKDFTPSDGFKGYRFYLTLLSNRLVL